MQAVLTELIEAFKIKYPEGMDIVRLNSAIMSPAIRGKVGMGIQLPLHAAREWSLNVSEC
ncbi:hypothetical protein SERLA73DRAFT_168651 [Serpula lacrymans var. lacrymans S7.3]|uniref:Uncharacterized protein n=2 Tax=Serpula lacrymans var. lacrymans TaxID=341189 RepID=F8PZ21_SERL3|nr:uncharacterized protein SERLADRAFT_468374 [Serpula lacrymans var. lacrymans S7.9]EGN99134.1 hypothetical protein SERLA73DRAFT_168651 [Serpula lacrymans var. lacrymans S7.3]EGO24701.1 hypothetical protein SERLADRAFT_468374 [Serpula lacrymans var. lacrymans S7.9]